MKTPRPEYPRPQFIRKEWLNLNGIWSYQFDFGKSGMERGFQNSKGFGNEILVPFCPESKLSGVEYKDFIGSMWYHKIIVIPKSWQNKRILIHFGGVDYEAELFVDGNRAGIHYGGTSSFYFDITKLVKFEKEINLVLRVSDELRTKGQPRGKQSPKYYSYGCCYTRTTGIWQTVWLEPVSEYALKNVVIKPDLDNSGFAFSFEFFNIIQGLKIKTVISENEKKISEKIISASQGASLFMKLPNPNTWSPEHPFLYDILFEVLDKDSNVIDSVKSYAGLRKIHIEGNKIFLNNQPLYQRLVLDQGFYPDGIWTAPSDEALKKDIELALKAGFNGARLHQKAFEERFHYWADKLGYLTWAESPSWGCNVNKFEDCYNMLNEWKELVERDRNHPSIITWTPLNETANFMIPEMHKRFHIDIYNLTKSLDPTRPVNDASGYIHVKTDLWTVHHYERPNKLKEVLCPNTDDGVFHRWPEQETKREGQPYLVDEFGGLKWIPPELRSEDDKKSWGYGEEIRDIEEFYRILGEEVSILRSIPEITGWCYTQLTDVEQEKNGIYNYDRTEKFDMKKIRNIFSKS